MDKKKFIKTAERIMGFFLFLLRALFMSSLIGVAHQSYIKNNFYLCYITLGFILVYVIDQLFDDRD